MHVADYSDFTMICKVSPRPYLRITNKISRNESHFSHLRRADDRIFIFAMQNIDLHIVTDIKVKLSSKERHGFEHCLKL